MGTPAVVGRVREGRMVLDVRTVFPHQEEALVQAVRQALAPGSLWQAAFEPRTGAAE
jgi:hypothetical protein